MYKYNIVVTGGTFDHLHRGHKAFLLAQFALSEKVLIGITSDAYIKKYKTQQHSASFVHRTARLKEFLAQEHVLERVEIAAIDDLYIPLHWQAYPIEAIVVTRDSKSGAEHINTQRKKEGLLPLEIVVLPHIVGKDEKTISSSRIRKGEIDRQGSTLVLPKSLREELQKPFGQLFRNVDDWITKNKTSAQKVVSIGDEVTEALLQRQFGQKVAVVDLFVQRKKRYSTVFDHALVGDEHIISITNPAGQITSSLFKAAKTALVGEGKYILQIKGEEDLAVLPFVLLSPVGFQIIYGQPQQGIVVIPVTDEWKQRSRELLKRFTIVASN